MEQVKMYWETMKVLLRRKLLFGMWMFSSL